MRDEGLTGGGVGPAGPTRAESASAPVLSSRGWSVPLPRQCYVLKQRVSSALAVYRAPESRLY